MSAKDLRKPRKKKVSPIVKDKIEYVDYKDVNLLRAFISDRAKIRGQRVSGNNRQQQREVAKAIKVARELALIPYAQRVVTQRKGDRRRGRSDRDDARYEDRDDAGFEDMTDETQLDMQENEYSEPAEIDDVAAVDDTMEEVTSE
ncbi:MAG TPA: 30S ribosomal protein S18 [Acidimicrobiaceae bacterium]|nr:30S ribosomal protein S18 [Acidimicrobiaceae bacterium]HBU41012.1 30S ribosomal protein S18 [Acidimicrobiaceae bacterium]